MLANKIIVRAFLFFVLLFLFSCTLIKSNNRNTPDDLSFNDKKQIINYAYAVLDKSIGNKAENNKNVPKIDNYDLIYVTLINNGNQLCSVAVKGKIKGKYNNSEDIISAFERCKKYYKRKKNMNTKINITDIMITYLFHPKQIKTGIRSIKKNMELGIDAISFQQGSNYATYRESIPIINNLNHKQLAISLCKKAGLKKECYENPKTIITLYDTVTFKGDRNGNVIELVRLNKSLAFDEINNSMITKRLKYIPQWFLNNTNQKTGNVEYEYYPHKDNYSPKIASYARQMASVWAMTAIKNKLKDNSMDELIRHMIDYYILNLMKCNSDKIYGDYCYMDIKPAKISHNAFMILSLIYENDYPSAGSIKERLAKALLMRQKKEDGSFYTHFNTEKMSGVDFYPGEAMFALAMLYRDTGEEKYLKSVQKAFPYYRDYWRNNKNTAFIPWHTRAYRILYEETKDKAIADFIFEMNDWIIDKYQIKESNYEDKLGGMPKKSPHNSTAVYMEGLNDAYIIAMQVGDLKRVTKYKKSIEQGTRFTLLTQYIPQNSFYVKNRKRALGGFRRSLTSNTQRVDYTVHGAFALLKVLESGIFEK